MPAHAYQNTHTNEVYCSANCALEATLEGANGVMSPERFEEYVQDTTIHAGDWENLQILNRAVTYEDACGEVKKIDTASLNLDPDALNLCDRCFNEIKVKPSPWQWTGAGERFD